ncbi:MAG TPA: hypothetical protein VFH88_08630 [Candidatus Krumholzibacteria bacterium]|nr:hypothetical protein [Candidatus Krumholzibacteria bacterium]
MTHTPPLERKPARSYVPLALMVLYLVVVRLTIATRPDMFRSAAQAAVFAWPMLGVVAVVGVLGTWIMRRTRRFPEMWDDGVSITWRLWIPVALGIALGAEAIVVDRVTHWTTLAAQQMHLPSIHIEAPASFLIYPGGAVIVTILYYLLLVPLFLWICRGRGFPVIAALAALIEPATQDLNQPGGVGIASAVFVSDYAMNLGQVWLFRRAGFVPAVLLRVAFYAVWHMLWPALS